MNRLRLVVSSLTGRGDAHVIESVLHQIDSASDGAHLARDMAAGRIAPAQAHERMHEIEHGGDTRRAVVVDLLTQSLSTPIDREDLFRLSRSIDDVLDTLRDFVREAHIYQVRPLTRLVPVLDLVIAGIEALHCAVSDVLDKPSRVTRSALESKKQAGAVCRAYQYEIAELFVGEVNADTFKSRELVRRLDIAGSRLSEAADALADGAMKRWH